MKITLVFEFLAMFFAVVVILRVLLPQPITYATSVIATCSTAGAIIMNALFGEMTNSFLYFILLMVLDFVTGFTNAALRHEVSSRRAVTGFCRKMKFLISIAVTFIIGSVFNEGELTKSLAIYALGISEAISVLENLSAMDVPIPTVVKNMLAQHQNELDNMVAKPLERGENKNAK